MSGFTLYVLHSMGFDQCMSCVHHYNIIQNRLTDLQVPCAPTSQPFPTPPGPPVQLFYV